MCQLIMISTAWCTAKPKPSGSVIVCGGLARRCIFCRLSKLLDRKYALRVTVVRMRRG